MPISAGMTASVHYIPMRTGFPRSLTESLYGGPIDIAKFFYLTLLFFISLAFIPSPKLLCSFNYTIGMHISHNQSLNGYQRKLAFMSDSDLPWKGPLVQSPIIKTSHERTYGSSSAADFLGRDGVILTVIAFPYQVPASICIVGHLLGVVRRTRAMVLKRTSCMVPLNQCIFGRFPVVRSGLLFILRKDFFCQVLPVIANFFLTVLGYCGRLDARSGDHSTFHRNNPTTL
ncbi:hypothetical protein Tco_1253873 [Tanacetum coccineum]